jgi:hypothetical protein
LGIPLFGLLHEEIQPQGIQIFIEKEQADPSALSVVNKSPGDLSQCLFNKKPHPVKDGV